MLDLIDKSRFRVTGLLGSGSQGSVYRARDLRRDVEVAVKVMPAVDSRAALELKHEFRVASALSHPHLVRLHELFAGDGGCFFTMEILDGVPVSELAASASADTIWSLAGDLAQAIHALHEARRLHRDVKPANLMVCRDRGLVVLDFGFASPRRRQVGDGIGAPAYVAPELCSGGEASSASDWFSVGAVLWELLAGRPLVRDAHGRPLVDGSALLRGPQALGDVVRRLLCANPASRPDGRTVLHALERSPRPAELIPSVDEEVHVEDIVGRDAEIARLHELHRESSQGGRIARVIGPSGIGKTALVLGAIDHLGPDVALHRGRCGPREDVRFNALDQIMDTTARRLLEAHDLLTAHMQPPLAAALCGIFPVFDAVRGDASGPLPMDGDAVARLAARGFLRLIEESSRSRRVPIVFLDDLHWADRDSFRFLSVLVEEAAAVPVLVVLASRTELPELDGIGKIEDLHLHPLSEDDCLWLAAHWMGGDGAAAQVAASRCRGSPLFLRQIADQRASGSTAAGLPEDTDGTDGVEGAIRAALGTLPPRVRRLADFLSVVGRPIHAELARKGAECDACDLFVLHDQRLLRTAPGPSGPQVAIYHDSIQEVLHLDMRADRRTSLHLRAASLLEADGARAEEIVGHYVAGERPDRGAHLAEGAAEAAFSAFAFNRAADLYGLLLETFPDRPDTVALRERLGDALSKAGRCEEAASAYLAAAQGSTQSRATDLRRRASEQLLRVGNVERGLEVLNEVLRELRLPNPGGGATTLAWLAWMRGVGWLTRERRAPRTPDLRTLERADACFSAGLGLNMIDVRRSMLFQSVHLALARRSGDPLRLSRSLAVESTYASTRGARGSDARADRLIQRSRSIARQSGEPTAMAFADLCHGVGLTVAGEFRSAIPLLDAASERYRAHQDGVTWEIANCHLYKCWSSVYLGEIEHVRRLVPRHRREAEHRSDALAQLGLSSGICVVAGLADGMPDEAEARAHAARQRLPRGGFESLDYFDLMAKTTLALYRGEGARAHALVREAWPRLRRGLFLSLRFFRCELRFLRGRAAVCRALEVDGRSREALVAEAARQTRRLRREPFAFSAALGAALEADLLALDPTRDATRHLERELGGLWRHCPLLARLFEEVLAGGGTLHDVADPAAFLRTWMPASASLLAARALREPRLPLPESLRRPLPAAPLEQR